MKTMQFTLNSGSESLTQEQGKRLFVKDIIHYVVPPNGPQAQIAPYLQHKKRGVGTIFNAFDRKDNGLG